MKKSILYIIIIILIISNIYFYFLTKKDTLENEPLEESLEPSPYYSMANNLSCEVKLSNDRENIGRVLSLLDLNTDSPKLLSDLGGTSPMVKIYEDKDTLIIGLSASLTGSTDIFVLDKQKGIFARTESGNLLGVFAFASKGICK